MLFQQTIDEFNGNTRTRRNALFARGFEQIRVFALCRRHRIHNGDLVLHHFAIEMGGGDLVFHFGDAGDHAHQPANTADLFDLLQLVPHIGEIELALAHPLGGAHRLFLVDILDRLFDERDHIAHAQNAVGDARGMEILERIHLFAGADELDRFASDRAHRKRCAATAIAIDAGEHNAGNPHALVKGFCGVHRVLAGQRVRNQQHFMRLGDGFDFRHFRHQRVINRCAAGGIEHHDIKAAQARRFHRALGDLNRTLACNNRQDLD